MLGHSPCQTSNAQTWRLPTYTTSGSRWPSRLGNHATRSCNRCSSTITSSPLFDCPTRQIRHGTIEVPIPMVSLPTLPSQNCGAAMMNPTRLSDIASAESTCIEVATDMQHGASSQIARWRVCSVGDFARCTRTACHHLEPTRRMRTTCDVPLSLLRVLWRRLTDRGSPAPRNEC